VDISHSNYEEQMGVVNQTLREIGAAEKPMITIFNKMDLYETTVFDEWLEESTKQQLLKDLHERWERETQGNVVFIAAIEKRNIKELRHALLHKVKELYRVRYPYKSEFLH
jgi:GTP-binding protein HflX